MADRKISDLTALTTPASGDYLPIVDISEASAANKNKRITVEELLRGAPDGTAGAPGIAFESDPNTGIYSPGADQVAISTNGTQRINIEADGDINIDSGGVFYDATNNRLAVGTTTAFTRLTVGSGSGSEELAIFAGTTGESNLVFADASSGVGSYGQKIVYNHNEDRMSFVVNASERARIDSSGRLLVGTSSARTDFLNTTTFGSTVQIETATASSRGLAITNNASTNSEALLFLNKSNGSSNGSNTVVADGNRLGSIHFQGADGLELVAAATISAEVDGTPGANDMPGRIVLSTTKDGQSSPTAAVTIDSSQRLLVGTSSARSNFDSGTASPAFQLEGSTFAGATASLTRSSNDSGTASLTFGKTRLSNTIVQSQDSLGAIYFEGADGTNMIRGARIQAVVDGTPGANDMPGRLVFATTADGASSPTERMRISNNGTTNIFSSDNGLNVRVSAAAGTATALHYGLYGATSTATGTISYVVWSNGDVQNTNNSYGAYSDIKLKENIVDANSQWDDIKTLQVRNYNLKEGQTHTQIGLIAQEVELVSPGLVSESPDRDADGNDLGTVTKSVNYSVLYMKAVKALQEAMERIETLEAKVAALESA